MPTQASDINRDVGQVSPNNYIRQGVENNVASKAALGLTQAGLDIDQDIATRKLAGEVNELTSQYLNDSPVNTVTGTGAASVDADTAALKNELATGAAARDQGRISYSVFQSRVERKVREAMVRRPGLSQEFRRIGAEFSGGPGVEWLMQQEADAISKAASAKAKEADRAYQASREAYKKMQEAGLLGPLSGSVDPSPEEIQAQFTRVGPRMAEMAQTDALYKAQTQRFTSNQQGIELGEPDRISDFHVSADKIEDTVRQGLPDMMAKLANPDLTPDERVSFVAASQEQLNAVMTQIQAQGSVNRVPQADIDARLQPYKDRKTFLESVPGMTTDQLQLRLKNIAAQDDLGVLRNSPTARAMATIDRVNGVGTVAASVTANPNGNVAKGVLQVYADTLENVVRDPGTGITFASQSLDLAYQTAFPTTEGGVSKGVNQEGLVQLRSQIPRLAQYFTASTDAEFFKASGLDAWGRRGVGFLDKVDMMSDQFYKAQTDTERADTAVQLGIAANGVARRALQGLVNADPSLKGLLYISFNPNDPQAIHAEVPDGGALSRTQQYNLDRANQLINVPTLYKVIGKFAGYESQNKTADFLVKLTKSAATAVNRANTPAVPKQAKAELPSSPRTTPIPAEYKSEMGEGDRITDESGNLWERRGETLTLVD